MFWGGRGRSRVCGFGERSAFVHTGLDAFLNGETDWLDPPGAAEMDRLAALFGGQIPDPVRLLYQRTGGSEYAPEVNGEMLGCWPMRIDEVERTTRDVRDIEGDLIGDPVWLFADFCGNVAGVYRDGPCAGFVTVWDHEDPDCSPRWLDLDRFFQSLFDRDADGEFPMDLVCVRPELPRPAGLSPAFDQLAVDWLDRAMANDDPYRSLKCLMWGIRLLPLRHAGLLLPFLDVDDPWISAAAADQLGDWDVSEAISQLTKLVQRDEHKEPNARIASVRALDRMSSPDARDALQALWDDGDSERRGLIQMYTAKEWG